MPKIEGIDCKFQTKHGNCEIRYQIDKLMPCIGFECPIHELKKALGIT